MHRDVGRAAEAADELRLGPQALLADGIIRGVLRPGAPAMRAG
jgi:hypothetical protein